MVPDILLWRHEALGGDEAHTGRSEGIHHVGKGAAIGRGSGKGLDLRFRWRPRKARRRGSEPTIWRGQPLAKPMRHFVADRHLQWLAATIRRVVPAGRRKRSTTTPNMLRKPVPWAGTSCRPPRCSGQFL